MIQMSFEYDDFKVEINNDLITYTVGKETTILPARFEVIKSEAPFSALILKTTTLQGDQFKFKSYSIANRQEMFLMLGRTFGIGLDKKIEEEKIRLALNDASVWQNFLTTEEATEISAHTAREMVIDRIIAKHKLKKDA